MSLKGKQCRCECGHIKADHGGLFNECIVRRCKCDGYVYSRDNTENEGYTSKKYRSKHDINLKKKKYYIVYINCDCGLDTIARTNINWIYGPRCNGCNKVLGLMEWKIVDIVQAVDQFDALNIWRKK